MWRRCIDWLRTPRRCGRPDASDRKRVGQRVSSVGIKRESGMVEAVKREGNEVRDLDVVGLVHDGDRASLALRRMQGYKSKIWK